MRELEGRGFVVGLFEDRRGIISSDKKVIPIGQIVLEDTGNKLRCLTSTIFTGYSSEYKSGKAKDSDKYFGSLAGTESYSAISVGFGKSYQSIREKVLEKAGISSSEFPRDGRKKLKELVHTRKDLGTLLLDIAMLIANQTGKETIQFISCGRKSQGFIKKSGYPFIDEVNEYHNMYRNYEIPTLVQ